MFITALFTIARIWKQPTNKCPSTQEGIKNIGYTYIMEYYSAKRKNEIMPFTVTWMDLEIVTLSELSQTKANIAYMWNLKKKKGTNGFIYRTEIELQMWEIHLWLPGRKGEEG